MAVQIGSDFEPEQKCANRGPTTAKVPSNRLAKLRLKPTSGCLSPLSLGQRTRGLLGKTRQAATSKKLVSFVKNLGCQGVQGVE